MIVLKSIDCYYIWKNASRDAFKSYLWSCRIATQTSSSAFVTLFIRVMTLFLRSSGFSANWSCWCRSLWRLMTCFSNPAKGRTSKNTAVNDHSIEYKFDSDLTAHLIENYKQEAAASHLPLRTLEAASRVVFLSLWNSEWWLDMAPAWSSVCPQYLLTCDAYFLRSWSLLSMILV